MSTEGRASGQNPDLAYAQANAEANETFGRLREIVERVIADGAEQVDIMQVATEAGLEVDDNTLRELKIPPLIPVLRFIDWTIWLPWRPLWCLWWERRYPYYQCCNYWWCRCHWYPILL